MHSPHVGWADQDVVAGNQPARILEGDVERVEALVGQDDERHQHGSEQQRPRGSDARNGPGPASTPGAGCARSGGVTVESGAFVPI